LVKPIYGDETDLVTGTPFVEAFELRIVNPITGEKEVHVINKNFINI
jgi:hypothetical protein